jgi:sphinganine-1-phosphate aldolase
MIRIAERAVFTSVCIAALNTLATEGTNGFLKSIIAFFRKLPGVNQIISLILDSEVKGATKLLAGEDSGAESTELIPIPAKGLSTKKVEEIMGKLHGKEDTSEKGRAFAYTYTSEALMGDFSDAMRIAFNKFTEGTFSASGSHEDVINKVWGQFLHTNGLNPMMYPSLRRFETEVCSMVTWMLNGDSGCAGSLTSGGTESILMAIKTYRDRARKLRPHISRPNMIVATTVHPAFEKAGHYFDVEVIHVPVTADYRMDMAAVKKAIDRNTILLVGSAPQYCHCVVDPIEELSVLAIDKGLPLHVDACFGGFMLPWLEKLGEKIPLWDFRVPGVTSITADIHKYGFCCKGASVVVYRTKELRSHQFFAYSEWPGGLFGSPSMAGSRPGGLIAAAWAALSHMGQDGYMEIAALILLTTKKLLRGVEEIDGIRTMVSPNMTALAIEADDPTVSILAVADAMERHGWKMERQQLPDSLHMSVLPQHAASSSDLLNDLAASVAEVCKLLFLPL